MAKRTSKVNPQKKINLALQGGGAHGAFTWGVLDAFLERDCFDFEGISAASAGSMNAVVLTQGLIDGGPEKARANLDKFWTRVSETGAVFSPVSCAQDFLPQWAAGMSGMGAAMHFMNLMAQNLSPYQFNPFNLNPLKTILGDLVDFKKLRKFEGVELFISATNVRTGAPRIFTSPELTCDMVLASAALPNIFQAVKVENEYYWDGGYVGNPSLWPLFYEVDTKDVMILHVNPIVREEIPQDAPAIENRLNEITFNASLLSELRAIAFVQKLLDRNMLKDEHRAKYKDVLVHAIRAESAMGKLDLASKFDTSWVFLSGLKQQGRKMANEWMDAHFDQVGQTSTIDISSEYLCYQEQPLHKAKTKAAP